jgi:hypothetical protein
MLSLLTFSLQPFYASTSSSPSACTNLLQAADLA